MKKVCILGCGRLSAIVAGALKDGKVEGVELAGVCSRTPEKTRALAQKVSCAAADSLDALLALKPDYVVEAATGATVRQCALPVLAAGADLIVLSTGAFSDSAFYAQVLEAAERYDRHVYLAPGVVGGFDIMEAARLMGPVEASFTKRKLPSASGLGDPALQALDDHFHGTAAEAYSRFPDHLNVAVSVALATCGLDRTRAAVESGDCVSFTTELSGAFGKASIYTELGTVGPELAAWSAVAVLRRLNSRICF